MLIGVQVAYVQCYICLNSLAMRQDLDISGAGEFGRGRIPMCLKPQQDTAAPFKRYEPSSRLLLKQADSARQIERGAQALVSVRLLL